MLFVGGFMSYLPYLCLFSYSGVKHILCRVFVLLVFVYVVSGLPMFGYPVSILQHLFSPKQNISSTSIPCFGQT